MSSYPTWAEVKAKVEADLDLEGESFITESEMLGYANEGIEHIYKNVLTIYEDYFVSTDDISLVSGQDEYDFPSDIYAMKIRAIEYVNGSSTWTIPRFKEADPYGAYEAVKASGNSSQLYSYLIINKVPGAPKIRLSPIPLETGTFIKIYYLRSANKFTDDTSILDLPECFQWLVQYIKVRCYEKEVHPNLQKAMGDLEAEKQLTVETLTQKIPDGNDEIPADTRYYQEMR